EGRGVRAGVYDFADDCAPRPRSLQSSEAPRPRLGRRRVRQTTGNLAPMTAHTKRRILQVNACDGGGGAYRVGEDLHREYRNQGHDAWLAVGRKATDAPGVVVIPNDANRGLWARGWVGVEHVLSLALGHPLYGRRPSRWLRWVGQ